jgi:RHS repeat-associated protein
MGKYVGTTQSLSVLLTPMKANTWYEAILVLDSADQFRAVVWEKNNPQSWAEKVETHTGWTYSDWQFYDKVMTGVEDLELYQEFDGGAVGQRTKMEDGSGFTTWTYDSRGRVKTESKTITGSGTFLTQWGYNAADLPTQMIYPGGSSGQAGEEVDYTYNAQMALDTVIGADHYVSGTSYDAAGRVKSRDLGSTSSSGELLTNYTYYGWYTQGGRLWTVKSGTPADNDSLQYLEYHYDTVGNIDWIKDYNAGGTQTQTFTYDALNRLLTAVASGGSNGTYPLENYNYDPNTGNLSSKAGVSYTYNPANKPHAVRTLTNGWSFPNYDSRGNMTRRVHGSETYDLFYDEESRLVQVKLNSTEISSFVYDGDGNRVASVDEYQNLAAGAPVSSDVTLNNADVATNGDTWANSGSSSSREFANGTSGLHYAQVDLGAAYPVDKVIVWHYAGDGRTYHQTKVQVSADGTNWVTVFSSDSTPPSEYPETAAGKTVTFNSQQVRYVRDWLNGSTVNPYNHWVEIEVWGKATTAYVGNNFEWHGTTSTMVKYYYAGGQRVAMRQGNGTGTSQLYYLLSDHLGSTAMQVDAVNANPLTDLRYKPWGEPRSGDHTGTTPTDFRFTGQRMDSGLGLYFYGARWYDSMLGRFLSPDSIIPDPGSPSSWDRYAYTLNNPVRYSDPSGHAECEGWRCGTDIDILETAKVYEAMANSMGWDEYYGHKKEYFSTVAAYYYARAEGAPREVQESYIELTHAKHSALVMNGFEGRDSALNAAFQSAPPESIADIATGAFSIAVFPGKGGVYSLTDKNGQVMRVGHTNNLDSREREIITEIRITKEWSLIRNIKLMIMRLNAA